jgi:hypothetical protein
MKHRLTVAGALTALLLAAQPGLAQVASTGTISVVVEDQAGARVPGALVVAQSRDGISKREAVTNTQGEASLVSLEPSAQYTVTTSLAGFKTVKQERILVRSGQNTALKVAVEVSSVAEEVTVVAESPVVDTTSAVTGQDITLELTESLPTGRTYQSYLQLVPGVLPDSVSAPGNPASKSGINYSDIGGDNGVSSDNFYYIDGINVTDPVTGTFGANLNTEIIQEQKVITGGIPAEFVGSPGLISNVVTKSGSNDFHGSVNYFFQTAGLQSENKNAADQEFSKFDTAFTLGGPIVKDKAWFFASYRRLEQDDDVTALDTSQFMRTVERNENQWYGRGTWSPSRNDTVSFTFANDPTTRSGRLERDITNFRDRSREQGGNRYRANYIRILGSASIDLSYSKQNGEVSEFSTIREDQNTVVYRRTDVRTLADEQRGGFGRDLVDERDVDLYRAALQWGLGRHTIKAGLEYQINNNFRNSLQVDSSQYTSLANILAGTTAGQISAGSTVYTARTFQSSNASDFGGFINTINGLPNRASFYAAFDVNRDGTITQAELGQTLVFNSTAGNPHGAINYGRTEQVADGEQTTKSKGLSFFVQDVFQWNRLTVNAGLRLEEWKHFATTGENIYTFDWTVAPRVSLAYDLKGDGKMKLTGYYGKYFDPIRNNMTNFAGTLTGAVREEQVFANGQWVNYRTRGGPVQQDAFFAPTTKTPFVDDLQFGYQVDLGRGMSFEALYSKRRTRDILEDYDLALYAYATDGTTLYPGPIDHPDSLFLGLDYFGYNENPGSNFVIATLAGGARDYQGFELTFRKRFANQWQALASYSYNDLTGNTNSDSNADFQGDVDFLDPRAPNQSARQPGAIGHLFKLSASKQFTMGLELGATYSYNSGTFASKTFRASGRNLPIEVEEPFEYAGYETLWIAPGAVGSLENPSFGLLDFRVKYMRKFGKVGGEVFVDVFNVFDNQDATRNQDLVAGQGTVDFGEGILFNFPRRFFLGARMTF